MKPGFDKSGTTSIFVKMGGRLMVGAMSGTSADGVDAAVVRIEGAGLEMKAHVLCHCHNPYDAELRRAIFEIRSKGAALLSSLGQIGRHITLAYAETVNEAIAGAGVTADQISAVAAHGQTLFHEPPLTIQWFDPSLLACQTSCAVVSDFRRADCAVGGQGAPLVPFADYILFRHPEKDRVLLNIGGIANLTYLRAGQSVHAVRAFDCGPGNCLSDWICRQYGPYGLAWDVGGAGASRGRVILEIATAFRGDPFFAAPPPKSTDGPAMISAFDRAIGSRKAEMNDLLATAAYLTTSTIADAVRSVCEGTGRDVELIVSGGGVHNKSIMQGLRSQLDSFATVRVSQDLGMQPDAKEAVAFALLGAATLDGIASNIPAVTGAQRAVVLGSITPRP